VDGTVRRFRRDVRPELRRRLEAASADDMPRQYTVDGPIDPAPFAEILTRVAPVQRSWAGPAFSFPDRLPASVGTVVISEINVELLHPLLAGWAPDVQHCQPMVAMIVDDRAVAVCCTVRRTVLAHEAGVETAAVVRGRGYAAPVVSAWARAVRALGREPLYSTSWRNEASRAVARKLGLIFFGSDLHLT
jgi:hypothetical protein